MGRIVPFLIFAISGVVLFVMHQTLAGVIYFLISLLFLCTEPDR